MTRFKLPQRQDIALIASDRMDVEPHEVASGEALARTPPQTKDGVDILVEPIENTCGDDGAVEERSAAIERKRRALQGFVRPRPLTRLLGMAGFQVGYRREPSSSFAAGTRRAVARS